MTTDNKTKHKKVKKPSVLGNWLANNPALKQARKGMQIFGNKLSGMIMPLIGVIMAWGFLTAFFIHTGWTPVSSIENFVVGPTITYLIPTLIGFMGGYNVYDKRGGFIGAAATFALVCGTQAYIGGDFGSGASAQHIQIWRSVHILGIDKDGNYVRDLGPQFLGAMILGPLSAYFLKKTEAIWDGKVKSGFEMLVNNFYFAFVAFAFMNFSFFLMLFPIMGINYVFGEIINGLTSVKAMPVTSLFVEPAKPLFLNNAINHGVFTPLGVKEASMTGQSMLFWIESNPGPGMGMLLGVLLFDKDSKIKSQAGAASVVHFFGGIHEVYFPFIIMRPILILSTMAGGVVGVAILQIFGAGAISPASPGSIIALYASSAHGALDYAGLSISIFASLGTSFIVTFILIKFRLNKQITLSTDLGAAVAKMNALKGSESKYIKVANTVSTNALTLSEVVKYTKKIVFACDAGMGSSAMGATLLRKMVKDANIPVTVTNTSISSLPNDVDIIVTQKALVDRAMKQKPGVFIYAIDQFLGKAEYEELLNELKKVAIKTA